MSNTKTRLRAALSAMKRTGKRDLGVHLFMVVFGLIVIAVAIPIVLLLQYLPDWAWYALCVIFVIWWLFGDTLSAGYRAFRGDQL